MLFPNKQPTKSDARTAELYTQPKSPSRLLPKLGELRSNTSGSSQGPQASLLRNFFISLLENNLLFFPASLSPPFPATFSLMEATLNVQALATSLHFSQKALTRSYTCVSPRFCSTHRASLLDSTDTPLSQHLVHSCCFDCSSNLTVQQSCWQLSPKPYPRVSSALQIILP